MLSHQVKLNKSTHARRHFTLRSNISHAQRISQIPQGIYLVEKPTSCNLSVFLAGAEGVDRLLRILMARRPLLCNSTRLHLSV